MTTKFYQINGVWNTYQYWHDNYGYTTEPTQSMNFKSSASGTWGTAVNPGYFASPGGYTIDNWSFWSDGIVGWKDIDQLALAGAYPATAVDILLERNGAIANAVYVDDSDEFYYLIDGYLSDGWRTWNEVEADGWQVYEGNPPYYMVVNETTGEVVYSISETEDNPSMVFSQVGHIEMPDSDMITVYETGVHTESFYFTTNGRNETQNTNISHADIPVYNEDGTAPAADTPYDGSSVLAFMDVDGNTKQADGESLYVEDGTLRLDAPDTDEGEQWAALVEYIEPEPPAPTLPTVEVTNGWAVTGSSAEYCNTKYSVPLYDNNKNRIPYDSTKSYVVQIGNGSGTAWRIEFYCASDSSGYLVAWNRTNVDLLVLGVSIHSCGSKLAYRVIVSDSSNVKCPAFAYDLDGTTYYYVLDNTQTDWTDDLSAIGYSLVTGSDAYLTSLGDSETVNTSVGPSNYYLYSSSGAYLYGNQSKKYVLIGQFLKDGTNVTNDGMDSRLTTGMSCSAVSVSSNVSSWNKLRLDGNLYSYNAFRITYLEV